MEVMRGGSLVTLDVDGSRVVAHTSVGPVPVSAAEVQHLIEQALSETTGAFLNSVNSGMSNWALESAAKVFSNKISQINEFVRLVAASVQPPSKAQMVAEGFEEAVEVEMVVAESATTYLAPEDTLAGIDLKEALRERPKLMRTRRQAYVS